MNLRQLRYLFEIEKQQLNISKAASFLCTSQSGVSKQIKLLEQELEIDLFVRNGRKLIALTPPGEKVLTLAEQILNKVEDIKQVADEFADNKKSIVIATTHTQARYVLPIIVEQFLSLNPDINLNIQQGTPEQAATLLAQGEVDIAIATELLASREALVALPCYQWSRSVIVKKDHALAQKSLLTLEDIVQYPIITYVTGFTGRYKQDEAFEKHNLQPNIVLTAVDADVIKTYVRLGLGIGIIADMAFSPEQDKDLVAVNVEHLFGISTSQIAIKKDRYIKPYIYPFIELFAPHLRQSLIRQAIDCDDLEARQLLFLSCTIPMYG
ncbi:MAG: CysB family HTH-type transcriptional regulator [Methylococcales bacterium]|nr:CysB family HTH-type transcriptional regulator [Methylococcales bacterium]